MNTIDTEMGLTPGMAKIPEHTRRRIYHYIVQGRPTGDFLSAVISNDLFRAFGKADIENRHAMFDIVAYFYSHAPAECWGSPKAMTDWIALGGLSGRQAKAKKEAPA